MTDSKDALEQKLQTPIRTLCYPYGSFNEAVMDMAGEAGYTQAVTTEFGRVSGPQTRPCACRASASTMCRRFR